MKKIAIIITALFTFSCLTGFGLKDVTSKVKNEIAPNTEKCDKKKNKKTCKNKEIAISAAKVAAIAVAAKLIYDMAVNYKTKNTKSEKEVSDAYVIANKDLPDEPTVVEYNANLAPSNIAQIGKEVKVQTSVTVVPSKKTKQALIEERIEIFDNEDNTKVIKSLVKKVNGETRSMGSYENQFTFTLPQGMPQGVYPIKTAVIVAGKEQPSKPNAMQVVLQILENGRYQIASLR